MSQQHDFLNVSRDFPCGPGTAAAAEGDSRLVDFSTWPPEARARLAADILRGEPAEPTGPISPTLPAAALRAGKKYADAIERLEPLPVPEDVQAEILREMARDQEDEIGRMRAAYRVHQPPTDYLQPEEGPAYIPPPQGIPDGYDGLEPPRIHQRPRPRHYLPSQQRMAEGHERNEAVEALLRNGGGRAQFTDAALEKQQREATATSNIVAVFCAVALVGFCAVGGWLLFLMFGRG